MTAPDASEYTVDLTTLTYGGEALGRLPDGRAVFVPFALPGERVRVRLVDEKRGHARAELLEIMSLSPERVIPFCPHFGVCGGCHYQHLNYSAQLAAKTVIVKEQLERLGGLSHPQVLPMVASPLTTHYRNHIEFHLTPSGKLGFHPMRSGGVFPLQECFLPDPTLNAIWPQLDLEAIPGLDRIGLRLGMGDDIQLILEGSDPQPPEFSVEDMPISAVHISSAGLIVLAGSSVVFMEVLGKPFQVSADAFFQVNQRMAEALVEHLLAVIPRYQPLTPQTTLLDIYCGVGLFSAFLAPLVGRLLGIELSASAANDFVANLDAFDHVELYEGAAEDILPFLEAKPDIVLVDPPRAGIDRRAMDALLGMAAPLLVYVSCDPATLARDARKLSAAGYCLEQVTPFDLFPHTYHIESVSIWTRPVIPEAGLQLNGE